MYQRFADPEETHGTLQMMAELFWVGTAWLIFPCIFSRDYTGVPSVPGYKLQSIIVGFDPILVPGMLFVLIK